MSKLKVDELQESTTDSNITVASGTNLVVTDSLTVGGAAPYLAGGTDIPIADGGTGASSASAAFTALKQSASESATGVVELATTSEVTTGTDTERAVTPAGVQAAVNALVDSAPGALDTLNELAAALGDDASYASTVTTALALKATIASPTFTGTIAIPNIANLETAVAANTAKNTNVSTDLGVSASGSAFTVTSSDGNNASLTLADTDNWGVMSDEMFDKLDGVETSADVTDATNVTAAGALMDSECAGLAALKATTGTFLSADESKLDGIEASADVTDATNVNAAGALMLSDTTTAGLGIVVDEDDMASDLATKVPTQQSVKAYVATQIASEDTLAEMNDTTIANLGDANLLIYESTGGVWQNKALSGDATIADTGVITVGADAITYAKMQNVSADERILGRVSGANGVIEELTKAQVLTFANVEDGADVTDAANVDAAGAVMDNEITNLADVKAFAFGSTVQAYDADLAAIAGLTSAADKGIQFTGSGAASTYDLTTAGKALLDDADASAQRTTLGLGTSAVLSTASIANGGTGVATADQIHTFVTTQTDDMAAGTSGNAATATLASTATVTDSTANTNFPVVFHNESNGLLDDTGALRYNPSTGELLVPKLTVAGTTTTVDTVTMNAANAVVFEGATANEYETTLSIVDPTADHTQYLINQGGYIPLLAALTTTAITATPEELNIMDAGTVQATVTLVDGDGVVISDGTVMKQALVSDFGTYAVAAVVTADNYLKNDASDATSGTITAGGFTTTGTWTFDEATTGTVGITTVQDSGTSFADNDTSFLTSAAVKAYVDSNAATAGFATAMAIAL